MSNMFQIFLWKVTKIYYFFVGGYYSKYNDCFSFIIYKDGFRFKDQPSRSVILQIFIWFIFKRMFIFCTVFALNV